VQCRVCVAHATVAVLFVTARYARPPQMQQRRQNAKFGGFEMQGAVVLRYSR
jgi:hypothetical protein